MSDAGALFAVLALVPAMSGPAQAEGGAVAALALALCGGGAMLVSTGGEVPPAPAPQACCAKGCHSCAKRRRLDRGQ